MSEDVEVITEDEWFRRMMLRKIYDVLFIDWGSGVTRVMDKFSGEIFDVSSRRIGNRIMLQVKSLS